MAKALAKRAPSAFAPESVTLSVPVDGTPRCGLCGKTGKLTKTRCCDQWICDDVSNYKLFSFATNSCYRNHDRYTLCSLHWQEDHDGEWQTCRECRENYETEMYVWFGTNEYNFVKLKNPPKYQPTKCAKCKRVIKLGTDGYSIQGRNYYCEYCSSF